MKTKYVAILLLALCAFFAGNVYAATVEVNYDTVYSYSAATGALSDNVTEFQLTIDGFETYGYCINPDVTISKGTYSYTPLTWNQEFYEAAWLMDNYAPTGNSKDETIALQAAIWTSVTGNSYEPQNNSFYAIYTSALASATFDTNYLEQKFRLLDVEGNRQPLIAAVPIPGAVFLLGSGLIGLIGIRRRKIVQHR